MMTDPGQAMLGEMLNVTGMRFLVCAMYILVQALVGIAIIRLRIIDGPGFDFIFVNPDLDILQP